jgi:prephenate dehydratase
MERRVAFLGPNGTFTEEVARFFFADKVVTFIPFPSISDALDSVQEGKVDYAVVPIENSIEGSVNLTMDWLIHQVDLTIRAELAYPISQHLMSAQNWEFNQIKKVLSHPQAIAQCRMFLHEYLSHAEIEYTKSTAEGVKVVSEHPNEPWVAIGPSICESIYSVHFLREFIQDHSNNYTRFILVGSEIELVASEQAKSTILVTLPEDFPGALYQVLAAFAWRKINLARIESRPTKKGLGSYHFIIDIEQQLGDTVLLPGAIAEIEALGCQVRQLGAYPSYVKKIPQNEEV